MDSNFVDTNPVGRFKLWVLWVLSITPKIPEISVGIQMEGPFRFPPTESGSPLELVHLHFDRNFRPKFAVSSLASRFLALIREFGKGIKNGKSRSNIPFSIY